MFVCLVVFGLWILLVFKTEEDIKKGGGEFRVITMCVFMSKSSVFPVILDNDMVVITLHMVP